MLDGLPSEYCSSDAAQLLPVRGVGLMRMLAMKKAYGVVGGLTLLIG